MTEEEQSFVIGFDARISPLTLESLWPSDRRDTYLIRRDSPFILSVDSLVWPSVFDTGEGIGLAPSERERYRLSGIEISVSELNNHKLMNSLSEVEKIVKSHCDLTDQHVWIIAVTASNQWSDFSVQDPKDTVVPGKIAAEWEFLGYDVVSESDNISGISNCGHQADNFWNDSNLNNAINDFHLFTSFTDAKRARALVTNAIEEHSPFVVVGLWKILEY